MLTCCFGFISAWYVNGQGKPVISLICSYNFSLSHSCSNALAAKSTQDSNRVNFKWFTAINWIQGTGNTQLEVRMHK